MGRLLGALVFAAVVFFAARASASIEVNEPRDIGLGVERFALVIGNGAYRNVPTLPNTINDARAMSGSLVSVGFRVFKVEDADRSEMQRAVEQFLNSVTPGSEALIYYAGHGVELEGQNYLLPTDIANLTPDQRYSLRSDAISLSLLLEDLQSRSARVNIVLLDACRNNPFASSDGKRSLGGARGLSRLDPPQGTVVIYAAAAGETALDNLGATDSNPNGLFTRSLLGLITKPGLEIRQMVQELKETVYETALSKANHTQRPSYYDGLIGKFYFMPGEALGEQATAKTCEGLVRPGLAADQLLFADAGDALEICRAGGDSALLAVAEEQFAAQKALLASDGRLGAAYLRVYPDGSYADAVRTYVASLGATNEPTPEPEPEPTTDIAAKGRSDTAAAVDVASVDTGGRSQAVVPATLFPKNIDVLEELRILGKADLTRGVQVHLNRLGCEAGAEDGAWGSKGKQALADLELSTGQSPGTTSPTPELLAQLMAIDKPVCLPCFTFNGERRCE